jgi:hypothetical protein
VQRLADPPSTGGGSRPTPAPQADDTPAVAVSSRTVGLAELFAMASATGAGEEVVQRHAVESATPNGDLPVQAAAASADPAAAPAPAAPAPAGAAPGGPSGAELEEMARRLYEPLSSRLRAELWQDRERSGLLTDLRP